MYTDIDIYLNLDCSSIERLLSKAVWKQIGGIHDIESSIFA